MLLRKIPLAIAFVLFISWCGVALSGQLFNIRIWKEAHEIMTTLTNRFTYYDKEHIVVFNLPDNYRGVWMFANMKGSGLNDVLTYYRKRPYQGTLDEIASYNMVAPDNSVLVERKNDHYTVTLKHFGSWWWRKGLGATDYQTDRYQVHFPYKALYYSLQFTSTPPQGTLYLYQDGNQWKVLPEDKPVAPDTLNVLGRLNNKR
jgi:hypothetical protein